MANCLDVALRMPRSEQATRMRLMRDLVRQRNVHRWAAQMLLDASWLRRRAGNRVSSNVCPLMLSGRTRRLVAQFAVDPP